MRGSHLHNRYGRSGAAKPSGLTSELNHSKVTLGDGRVKLVSKRTGKEHFLEEDQKKAYASFDIAEWDGVDQANALVDLLDDGVL